VVTYTPSLIGTLYSLIFALGGERSVIEEWPSFYPNGLTGDEAHAQMMMIWLRAQIDKKSLVTIPIGSDWVVTEDGEFVTTNDGLRSASISEIGLARIKEHHFDEPENPFYAFMFGLYFDNGNLNQTIELLLRPDRPMGSYVVCGRETGPERSCALAEWLFVADLVLEVFGV
jgi:hypothetical protein